MPFAGPIGRRDRLKGLFDLALNRGVELREAKNGGGGSLRMLATCKTGRAEQEGGCRNSKREAAGYVISRLARALRPSGIQKRKRICPPFNLQKHVPAPTKEPEK